MVRTEEAVIVFQLVFLFSQIAVPGSRIGVVQLSEFSFGLRTKAGSAERNGRIELTHGTEDLIRIE